MANDPYAGLDASFAHRLRQLVQASGGRITITSGHRSVERQQQLWDAAVKKYGSPQAARKWVAPPGKSNHNRGIAADLGGDLALAKRLAPQFGLYMPMGHEPWHIEPAGSRSKSAPQAYTPPPDHDDDPDVYVPPAEPVHDVSFQLGNLMAALTGPSISSEVM